MKIKVCGITKLDQLMALEEAGADYAGLIFVDASPRRVPGTLSSDAVKTLNGNIQKTGVFADATRADVLEKIETYGLQAIQLHGNESPDYCGSFKGQLTIIKVLHPNAEAQSFDALLDKYAMVCDYFLFDAGTKDKAGGTGKKFDWSILDRTIPRPFFLSGGIGPEDAGVIKQFRHPDLYAVDINSRFETAPGTKDMGKVITFIHQLSNKNKVV